MSLHEHVDEMSWSKKRGSRVGGVRHGDQDENDVDVHDKDNMNFNRVRIDCLSERAETTPLETSFSWSERRAPSLASPPSLLGACALSQDRGEARKPP